MYRKSSVAKTWHSRLLRDNKCCAERRRQQKKSASRIEVFEKHASSRMRPTVTSLSCSEARVTSFIRWRVVNRGQCTKPAFLAGHYNARFTGSDVVCVRSCTRGPRAAVHVRALHRKIPGVRKVRFLLAMRKFATPRFRAIVSFSSRRRYITGYRDFS